LRATPHGEKPLSVEEYEKTTGKTAKDRQIEIWKEQGVEVPQVTSKNGGGSNKSRYND
jgi:sulfonate dioxygenase